MVIQQRGRLVLDEDVDALKARFRRIRFTAKPAALESVALRSWGSGAAAIVSDYNDIAFERYRASAAEIAPMTLEEIFVAVAGENGGAQ